MGENKLCSGDIIRTLKVPLVCFSDEGVSHQCSSSGLQGNYSVNVLEEGRKTEKKKKEKGRNEK